MLTKYENKLNDIKEEVRSLADKAVLAAQEACDAFSQKDNSKFEKALEILGDIQIVGNDMDNKIVTSLALFGPEAGDLRELVAFLKVNNELVRIGENIKTISKKLNASLGEGFEPDHMEYTIPLQQSAILALKFAVSSIVAENKDEAANIYRETKVQECKTDDFYSLLEKSIIEEIGKDAELSGEYIYFLNTMRKFERIGDRAVNIVKLMHFAKCGGKIELY